MIVCQGCGTENKDGAQFCSNCARKLDADTQELVVRTRAEHTATGLRWTSVVIALIIILIVAIALGFLLAHLL